MIGAGLAVLAGIATSLDTLEPWLPATRAFARAVVAARAAEVHEHVVQTRARIDANTAGFLSIRIQLYRESLRAMRLSLAMIVLRLREAPTDQLLLDQKSRLQDAIDQDTQNLSMVICRSNKLIVADFKCS